MNNLLNDEFIEFIHKEDIMIFGDFVLKSGRKSPYFFNFGSIDEATKLKKLGEYYAQNIVDRGIDFDIIFGPAYKGIPISLATAISLAELTGKYVPFAFNRKEEKNYGDAKNIIGAPLKDKNILVLDDVITSGKTIRETYNLIQREGGKFTSMLVALDRNEISSSSKKSAMQTHSDEYNLKIYSIANMEDVDRYLQKYNPISKDLYRRFLVYRKQYGV